MRAVNLIPSEQRASGSVGAGRSQGGAYAVLALLGGIAILALLYGMRAATRSPAAARRPPRSPSQAQQAQAEASRLAPYTSFIALREPRTQAVSELVNSRFDWAHAFHELGRVLPFEVSINSLERERRLGHRHHELLLSPRRRRWGECRRRLVGELRHAPRLRSHVHARWLRHESAAVALMLERLRLMDGVSEVTLQSSTKSSASGGSTGSGWLGRQRWRQRRLPVTRRGLHRGGRLRPAADSVGSQRGHQDGRRLDRHETGQRNDHP